MPTVSHLPTVHTRRETRNGIKIGCCRVCTCLHLEFLTTKCGLLKIFELLLGSCSETLLIRFGLPAATEMGEAFYTFHSTVSACLTTTFILLVSYIFSARTYGLIRQSIFEVLFNAVACCLYISASLITLFCSSSYVAFATSVFLYPRFTASSADTAYPAMICVYYLGFIISIVYGLDAFTSYKSYKGYA
ncbi:protein singles bar isoform X1 [Chironomus tepperi]|uniref:protein singles bar isoform X1 n=1 Tax=Chironomus tepperi TaxID=113505 RepID=UPI00391F95A7